MCLCKKNEQNINQLFHLVKKIYNMHDISIFLKKEGVINFQQINVSETYLNIVECYRPEIAA